MSQTALDDDELFGEAASEMRSDVEASLEEAWGALPDANEVWETDADNVLGVLNGLKTALDAGDAEDHLRDAKKWFTMGQRADAFDDADDLEAGIDAVEDAIEDVSEAGDQASDLTSTIPDLRNALQEAGSDEDESEEGSADEDAASSDEDEESADEDE